MLPAPRSPLPASSPFPALRIAVIGAGRLGGFHAQKLAGMANVELVGVVDRMATSRDRRPPNCIRARTPPTSLCWAASMRP